MDYQVEHDRDGQKFYVMLGDIAAYLSYDIMPDGTLDYSHTYVPQEFRGKGVAEAIVEAACEYARSNCLKVLPSCSYVEIYFRRHPESCDGLRNKGSVCNPSCRIDMEH